MARMAIFNAAQYEVINTMSCLTTDDDVKSLKDVLVQFLNARLQKELNRLWDEGAISQEKIDVMSSEHLRTAYH